MFLWEDFIIPRGKRVFYDDNTIPIFHNGFLRYSSLRRKRRNDLSTLVLWSGTYGRSFMILSPTGYSYSTGEIELSRKSLFHSWNSWSEVMYIVFLAFDWLIFFVKAKVCNSAKTTPQPRPGPSQCTIWHTSYKSMMLKVGSVLTWPKQQGTLALSFSSVPCCFLSGHPVIRWAFYSVILSLELPNVLKQDEMWLSFHALCILVNICFLHI